MKQEQFESVEDLINNDSFCEWVFDRKQEAFWQQWQKDNPNKQPLVKEAISFLQQFSFEKQAAEKEEMDRVLSKVWGDVNQSSITKINQSIPKRVTRRIALNRMKVAATILFLVLAGWYVMNYFISPYTEYTTTFAETKTITLPDNSTVVLQANSTLKTPKKWTEEETRQVWLEGEAFFSVTKKKTNIPVKFEVKTNDFTVEVLGTQFDVLHRAKNKRVVLQEGKIRMKWDNQPTIDLVPNEMISFSKETNDYQKETVNSNVYTAWTQEKLILNNTSLIEIARIFKDNYGYEVRFSSNVNQQQTRSSLGAIEVKNIDKLITIIAASYEVEIVENGNQLMIK